MNSSVQDSIYTYDSIIEESAKEDLLIEYGQSCLKYIQEKHYLVSTQAKIYYKMGKYEHALRLIKLSIVEYEKFFTGVKKNNHLGKMYLLRA